MIAPRVPDIAEYDHVPLRIKMRIEDTRILMFFTDEVEWILMTSGGARKIAGILLDKADELDKLYPEVDRGQGAALVASTLRRVIRAMLTAIGRSRAT